MWTAIRFRTFRSLRSRESRYDNWRWTGSKKRRYFRISRGLEGNVSQKISRMKQSEAERQRNLEKQFGPQNFKLKFGNSVVRNLYWAFRRFQYWLCFYDNDVEVDLEDLLTNPFNTQPPSLDEIQRLTGFRRDWLMFVYRNFKQICSNGRMCQSQWRQIFRLIFKGATDYDFGDRFFLAIAGTRSQKLITFEDLIFCLYDICTSIQDPEGTSQKASTPNMTAAQFVFSLMLPDQHGRVDEEGFLKYTRSIFDLNASLGESSASGDAATFGMIHQISTSNNSQSASTDKSGNSNGSKNDKKIETPWITNLAKKQFRILDVDGDGYITIIDIQRLFDQKNTYYESLYLKAEQDNFKNNYNQLQQCKG